VEIAIAEPLLRGGGIPDIECWFITPGGGDGLAEVVVDEISLK
jgi:hypothetical protein